MPNLPGPVHFVTQAPVADVVRLRKSVLTAQFAPFRSFVNVAIFHEGSRLLGSPRTQIESHQRFRACSLAPSHELIGPELVRVHGIPSLVVYTRPILLWPHAVQPVVPRDEVAAGITDDGNAEFPHFLQHIFAESIGAGHLGPRAVDALVDRAPQLLEKTPETITRQRGDRAPRFSTS